MSKNALMFVFLIYSGTVFGQIGLKFSTSFGDISKEELSLKVLEMDSTAPAAYIFDKGETKIYVTSYSDEFYLRYTRHFRIKVFDQEGLDQAQIVIPLEKEDSRIEEVSELHAVTCTMKDGSIQKTKLDKKQIYIEDKDDRTRIVKFSMPNVQAGSVFDVEYTVESPFIFYYKDWYFQHNIPVIINQYKAHMIPMFTYSIETFGKTVFDDEDAYISQEDITCGYNDKVYYWTLRNIPAFKNEPFMVTPNNMLIHLKFQLSNYKTKSGTNVFYYTTWPKLCDEYLNSPSFGVFLKDAQKQGGGLLSAELLNAPNNTEKVQKIYKAVLGSLKWNGVKMKVVSNNFKNFLRSKSGNSADLNLTLIALLRKAGLEAYPLLISTRPYSKLSKLFPIQSAFNYVAAVVFIDNKKILLDATSSATGFGYLPFECNNETAFIMKNDGDFQWLSIPDAPCSNRLYRFNVSTLSAQDSALVSAEIELDGYQAVQAREDFLVNPDLDYKYFMDSELAVKDKLHVTNMADPAEKLKVAFSGTVPVVGVGDRIIVKPFCSCVNLSQQFKNEKRNSAIDFQFKRADTYVATVTIPDGYELTTLPDPMVYENNGYKLKTELSRKDNVILAKITFEINKLEFPVVEYAGLREATLKLDALFGTNLIFKKKS